MKISGDGAQSQICSSRSADGVVGDTGALRIAKRLHVACRFLNDLPPLAQMFFCGEHIPEADPHYCSAAQFCLREIRAPGRVNSLYDVAVQLVELLLIRFDEPKTDHAHAGLSG